MERVLIATLGEFPVVVSATLDVLRDHTGMAMDRVQVLYPSEPNDRWIEIGYELLAECLQDQLVVEPVPLPFDDARTEEHSLAFLRLLNGYLQAHETAGNTVYLCLAGGRKHISALLAVLPQFYPCVQGLYHLHDTEADNPRRQLTIDQLGRLSMHERCRRLHPPMARFRLVSLPCQPLTQARSLQQWLSQKEEHNTPPPIPITSEAASFYSELFHSPALQGSQSLTLWLTHTAYEQYCALFRQGSSRIPSIDAYLRHMTKADWLCMPEHVHDHETDANPAHVQEGSQTPLNHFTCKRRRTAERVFYYTQPHAITAPHAAVEQVVVTRFPVHVTKSEYDIALTEWVKKADVVPRYRAADLPARRVTLIAPLGDTPMVVTQAYTLLRSPQHLSPPVDVAALHVVYPGHYPPADNGVRLLQSVCANRGIVLQPHALPIEDIDSDEAMATFIAGLKQAIVTARQQDVGTHLALLLSGGRKSMSALTFYVAQTEGIMRLYHTTILDPIREREIEEWTRYDALRSLSTAQQAELLFLERWHLTDFTLIPVPVIPFADVVGSRRD
jgi:hypothetical protein